MKIANSQMQISFGFVLLGRAGGGRYANGTQTEEEQSFQNKNKAQGLLLALEQVVAAALLCKLPTVPWVANIDKYLCHHRANVFAKSYSNVFAPPSCKCICKIIFKLICATIVQMYL